jgi:membrane-associated phospholipid phosphatase
VPAHTWRSGLAGNIANPLWAGISIGAQLVYFSHLFVFPGLLLILWLRGRSREIDRRRFLVHVRAFTLLHAIGILTYILLPVAPPWWVSLHGLTVPTPSLFASTSIQLAMDGVIIQRLIGNASQWFAAVPSLHAAYPVLLVMLQLRDGSKQLALVFAIYGLAMFAATVALNQHYIIDLLAGGVAALLAAPGEKFLRRWQIFSQR